MNLRLLSATLPATKGYADRFVFVQNAGHGDHAERLQTVPKALEFVWRGYATHCTERPRSIIPPGCVRGSRRVR